MRRHGEAVSCPVRGSGSVLPGNMEARDTRESEYPRGDGRQADRTEREQTNGSQGVSARALLVLLPSARVSVPPCF